jgi:peptide/nickel transport system permease protein
MWIYTLRRLALLPLTLFCIVLVNFIIINLAPGDPVSYAEISAEGTASRRDDRNVAFSSDERYLQFREFYGLTLPILFNTWPWLQRPAVESTLWQLAHRRLSPQESKEMSAKDYNALRITFGDQARFIMPILLAILSDPQTPPDMQKMAAHFFIRGGSRPGFIGAQLSPAQKDWNKRVTANTLYLRSLKWSTEASPEDKQKIIGQMQTWFAENAAFYQFEPAGWEKLKIFFFETRFARYFSRVLQLDFGTLRNDSSKTVMCEVMQRMKYSLTLSILPMFITFILCQLFGLLMAYYQKQWPDYTFNLFFLILYAIPIFVVAPFLIEKVALHHCFPFFHTPIPISGFTSPDRIYQQEVSYQRLFDVMQHLALPLLAILYGSLAAEARLSRTAVLEVLRQDYVRTARAKGLHPLSILFKHVGRNAGVTIVTSLAGSLGLVLGGSLIVETLFDTNGFGKFFYEAVLNRDYNVIMFSALAGSFLSLLGYLMADLTYMWLDPRVTLE